MPVWKQGQATSKEAAGDAPMHSGESVAVTIYLTGNVDAVVSFLEDNGGDPRNVGEDYIEAYVPVAVAWGNGLGAAGRRPGAGDCAACKPSLRPRHQPRRVQAHLVGSLATALAITGQGVKVGIIDVGF